MTEREIHTSYILPLVIVVVIIWLLVRWFKNRKLTKVKSNSFFQLYGTKKFQLIADRFHSIEDVSEAIRAAGLESSNIIFGVDFTKSNEWQGRKTFEGRCLHDVSIGGLNPYQQVIRILGSAIEKFDDDNIIPCFGFGDVTSRDVSVFPFREEGYCRGFHDALSAYTQLAKRVKMSGPTSFAPLIYKAIDIIQQTKSYHILVIIADGQMTSEAPTRKAIIDASNWPLSIILIGVGDGPWEEMENYDDRLPQRKFDNFQFVNYNKLRSQGEYSDAAFALNALMEIPDQYKAIRELGLLNF
ncbi:DgyrCDS5426 [Dimorphilus gyrociliatus]|uniref:DgyrCDS5426 n=1 Tax=Dimorphilus gyrociliatus TaxID=2664684 RepID=A0A7I8VK03_9ANNE|nr:DgyrCDS5426 [Dimorphilus gyrociliatus]